MGFSYHSFILKNDGTLWSCGNNNEGQLGLGDTSYRSIFTQITTNADDIKEIYCGYNHTLILKNDGTLWGCGYNHYGQLGLGDGTNRSIFTKVTTTTSYPIFSMSSIINCINYCIGIFIRITLCLR